MYFLLCKREFITNNYTIKDKLIFVFESLASCVRRWPIPLVVEEQPHCHLMKLINYRRR